MHSTNARKMTKTALPLFVIHNPRDLLNMIDRVSKKDLTAPKLFRKQIWHI
jgi:hypothetical protein